MAISTYLGDQRNDRIGGTNLNSAHRLVHDAHVIDQNLAHNGANEDMRVSCTDRNRTRSLLKLNPFWNPVEWAEDRKTT